MKELYQDTLGGKRCRDNHQHFWIGSPQMRGQCKLQRFSARSKGLSPISVSQTSRGLHQENKPQGIWI